MVLGHEGRLPGAGRHRALSAGLAALVTAGLCAVAVSRDDGRAYEATNQSRAAVKKGIAWLSQEQNNDGSWGCQKGQAPSTGLTGLASLALLAGGDEPRRGEQAARIQKALQYVMHKADAEKGLFTMHDLTGLGPIFDHAMTVTFLCESRGTLTKEEDAKVERLIRKALKSVAGYQQPDGGFGQGGASDLGTTAAIWMAARSANSSGVVVEGIDQKKMDRFLGKCYRGDGTFMLNPGGGGHGRFYPTASGLRLLYGLGKRDSKETQRVSAAIQRMRLNQDYGGKISEWDFVGAFYATQAFLIEDGKYWKEFFPRIRDQLVGLQRSAGFWEVEYCTNCRVFATALSLLCLEAPYRLLPTMEL